MTVEFQFRQTLLQEIAARAVQDGLFVADFPPVAFPVPSFIDHADVAGPVVAEQANDKVVLRIPIDVYLVTRAAVLAAPNGVPVGATGNPVRIAVLMTLSCATVFDAGEVKAVLSFALTDVEPAALRQYLPAIGTANEVDVSGLFQSLGAGWPVASRTDRVGDSIVFRFDPVGGARDRLAAGQDWGIFVGKDTVISAAADYIPDTLRPAIFSEWLNSGGVPTVRMRVNASFDASVLGADISLVTAAVTIDVAFSLTPTVTKLLRSTVSWRAEVDLPFPFEAFQPAARELARNVIKTQIASKGTLLSDTSIYIDASLPSTDLGDGRLSLVSLSADDDGMTMGGVAKFIRPRQTNTLSFSLHPMSLPTRIGLCSILAKGGDGSFRMPPKLADLTTSGQLWLEDCGCYGGFETVSPAGLFNIPWVWPSPGTVGDQALSVGIRSTDAQNIHVPVQIIVRTSRGVRLFDFGVPPKAIVDADGTVTNGRSQVIPDCLYISRDPDDNGIHWGGDDGPHLPPMHIPPFEDPDWLRVVTSLGVNVQLVTIDRLDAGELVQFRSRHHQVEVVADAAGRAVVPVFLPVAVEIEAASLYRANRKSLAGRFGVATAAFTTEEIAGGVAGFSSLLADQLKTAGLAGGIVEADGVLDAMPVDRELARVADSNRKMGAELGIPGVLAAMPIPGHEEASLAISWLADGTQLLVDTSGDSARVSGTIRGPLPPIQSVGELAFAKSELGLTLFRVRRA